MTAAEYAAAHNPADESAYYETCQNLADIDHLEQQDPAPQQDDQPAAA